jgi:endonuclease/exonuclease/phosphatase family metal-dependent hydrolase
MKNICLALLCLCSVLSARAQSPDTIRFVHYNLLKYGQNCIPIETKNARLKIIFDYLKPDILTVNEMSPNSASIGSLRDNALTSNSAMKYGYYGNSSNSDLVNMLYYNNNKLGYLSHTAITGNVRDVDVHRLYVRAATHPGDTLDFYCFTAHFKSSTGDPNVLARAATAQDIVDWLAARPQIKRYIISGDFNIYTSTEPAFQTLLQRFVDPSGIGNGWQGASYAHVHTQSPADGSDPCAVTGGMDDRFDFVLTSPELFGATAMPIRYVPGSYRAVGNDGNSYNTYLHCTGNTAVPTNVCNQLSIASDHLPVALNFVAGAITPVFTPADDAPSFQLFGNPVYGPQARIYCSNTDTGDCNWQLSDAAGRPLLQGEWPLAGGQMLDLPLGDLPTGLYFVSIRTNTGDRVTLRLMRAE